MKNSFLYLATGILIASCAGNQGKTKGSALPVADTMEYHISKYKIDYDGTLDTILPHFAKLHDSIPESQRYLPKNREYMRVHKAERDYRWLEYTEAKDGYCYFMVRRNEPSLKRDKYAAICGRFKRDMNGRIDSASYEEIFYTWKMRQDSLSIKSPILFKTVVEGGKLDEYLPEHSAGFWVEFPSSKVYYDKATQKWKTVGS